MKLFKKLFKILIVIIIILVLLLGTVVFLVYDNSLKENIYKDYPNDMNYEVSEIASNAIKDTKNTKIIDASLSEDRINYLLQSITNTMNSEFNGKMNIKGATVKIDENSNTEISVYFKVFGFPSSLKGKFVLSENEESIDIQILNASIGKIKASQSTMGSLAKTFLNEKDIKKGLSDKGIKIDLEIEKLKVSVIKSEIRRDIRR